ncbi:MAG: hypothetical protein AAGF25_01855 [Pseudomonadota bacterium]
MKHLSFGICAVALLVTQGCAARAVADAAVSTTVFASKTVVKGTVGAGKLVYNGGKAVANAGRSAKKDQAYTGGPKGATPPSCLEANGSYSAAFEDANGDFYCPG